MRVLLLLCWALAARAEPSRLDAIQAQLAEVRHRALAEDPDLRAAHDALEAEIEGAARAADPSYDDKLARLGILAMEIAGGDPEAAARAGAERRAIQRQLADAHAAVMARAPLAGRIAEGRARLLAAMARTDPAVPAMIAELEGLIRDTP